MKKISLNNNWICKRAGQPEQGMTVNIPHDAMQMDEKDELSAGGVHNGMYAMIIFTRRHFVRRKTGEKRE